MLRESNSTDLLERPLSARSLIASLLLRSQPSRMRGSRLVQWCELFGVAEGTTRVALSRMVDRGELRTRDGVYELAGRVQGRQQAQDWSLEPKPATWRGEWRIAVVESGPRGSSDRAALRDAMRRLRYAPRREGTWMRPDNLPRASAPAESWRIVDEQCSWWSGRPDDDAATLAEELFESAAWSERAVVLTRRLESVTGTLAASEGKSGSDGESLAGGFVAGAAALAHVRADPLLPREIAANPAAGAALRDAYRAYERVFSQALRAWFRTR
jgi:phenylacetic acid degradation operon negative regulatory protein